MICGFREAGYRTQLFFFGVLHRTLRFQGFREPFQLRTILLHFCGIFSTGTATVNDSLVSYNTAVPGGGLWNNGTLTVNSSEIHNNSASTLGGGLWNNGTLSVNSSERY